MSKGLIRVGGFFAEHLLEGVALGLGPRELSFGLARIGLGFRKLLLDERPPSIHGGQPRDVLGGAHVLARVVQFPPQLRFLSRKEVSRPRRLVDPCV